MKICTRCGKRKPLNKFYVHSAGKRPGLVSARCKSCEAKRMKDYYAKNKERKKLWFEHRYQRLKDTVFNAYGGYKCACCGETEPLFLTIDHIGNDGSEHRRGISKAGENYRDATGYKTYRWLVRNNFPSGFQVLCANCNHGKHRNHGVCPHRCSEGSTTRAKARTAKRLEVRSPS